MSTIKPSPLKEKIGYRLRNDFSKEDVAAAVEWLKEWIVDQKDSEHETFWLDKVDAAFPDVVEVKDD